MFGIQPQIRRQGDLLSDSKAADGELRMYGIQPQSRRQDDLLSDSKATDGELKYGLPPPPPLLAPSKTIGAPSGHWTHPNMTRSVRDLMADTTDQGEELHMSLPTSKRRCTDRSKMLMRLPFASTLPSSREVPPKRVRPGVQTPCYGETPAVLPLRRADPSSLEDDGEEDDFALRLKGEVYPRFRLDTIVGKEELASALCTFREDLKMDSKQFGKEEIEEDIECPPPDFVKSQEDIWHQIKQDKSKKRTTEQEKSPMNTIQNNGARSTNVAGTNIKILEQDRVYAALSDGSAMMLKCVGCGKHMLATSDISYVFCPNCSTLSPVDLANESSSHKFKS